MRTQKYIVLPIIASVASSLLIGCGNPNGTISHLRYQYTHQVLQAKSRIPNHFGEQVVIGDSESWVDSKWGKPQSVNSGSKGNETVTYPGNVTVTFINSRVSSIQKSTLSTWSVHQALAIVKAMLPSDSTLVTYHQAGKTSSQSLYEYSSQALATLVSAKIWSDSPYEVAGTIYVLMNGNLGASKVNNISIGLQSPYNI